MQMKYTEEKLNTFSKETLIQLFLTQQELRQQKEDAKAVMARLEEAYEARHEEYAQALFKSMIKE